jgi:plastocyanin/Cu/Ag efflux protein CusF
MKEKAMKRLLLTTGLVLLASPALAKEYTVKEISDPAGNKPYYFEPSELTIQPGDTVTFVNMQDDQHDVMFVEVPKGVDEMIMSPMHEREGDKFSYTFSVPGTYQYHCHAHEALGMKGTLIVGAASKPGETVVMDHHKMAKKAEGGSGHERAAASNLIDAVGKVNSADAAGHTINITHDPIKALNWPKMKMEFSVDPSIDLTNIKNGDAVSFTLKPGDEEDYTIVKLQKK